VDDAAGRQRADYYLAMAHATYDLAELCDDLEMLRGYVDVAGTWLRMADEALRATDGWPPQPLDPTATKRPESSAPLHPGDRRARPAV
jgi:hypothetical protein